MHALPLRDGGRESCATRYVCFRQSPYRELFRGALDEKPLSDLRLARNQDQPIGTDRFYREIEAMTAQRRELRQRGRPRKGDEEGSAGDAGQGGLPL